MLVVLWLDAPPGGPWVQLLAAVDDMGSARRLAREAEVPVPLKRHCIPRHHHLYALACARPGELLWRPDADDSHLDGFGDSTWRAGAGGARAFRQADAERAEVVRRSARTRRRERR